MTETRDKATSDGMRRTSIAKNAENDGGALPGQFFGSHDSLFIRVASGVVLGPVALIACYVGGPAFAGLIGFLVVLMAFEWTRMVAGRDPGLSFYALAVFSALAMIAAAAGFYPLAYALAGLAGLAAFIAVRIGGAGRWAPQQNTALREHTERSVAAPGTWTAGKWTAGAWAAVGAVYITAPSVALIWLRDGVDNGRGLIFLLFGIVWAADSAAYLGGRFFRGPRLSPTLSPAKTWSGAVCGVIAGGLVGFFAVPTLTGIVPSGDPLDRLFYGLAGAALGLASILGDILESAFKRVFGVKDSSGFIPGHGGVLDRLDGMIVATVSIALILYGQILFAQF
ncbi:MAG: phosphatidate cytidylyltransferase [Pseudomonadota bacterium]